MLQEEVVRDNCPSNLLQMLSLLSSLLQRQNSKHRTITMSRHVSVMRKCNLDRKYQNDSLLADNGNQLSPYPFLTTASIISFSTWPTGPSDWQGRRWQNDGKRHRRRWIGTFSYEDMGAGKCQSQRRWRQRSTARVTAKIRPGLLRPNPRIFLFADTSGRKHCNPWIFHSNENKKGHDFLSSRWGVAYNIFGMLQPLKKNKPFSIQIFK